MNPTILPLTERQAWKALAAHQQKVRELHLRQLFAEDPTRGERLTAEGVGLYKVLSRRISAELGSKPEPTRSHDSSTTTLIHRYRTR